MCLKCIISDLNFDSMKLEIFHETCVILGNFRHVFPACRLMRLAALHFAKQHAPNALFPPEESVFFEPKPALLFQFHE